MLYFYFKEQRRSLAIRSDTRYMIVFKSEHCKGIRQFKRLKNVIKDVIKLEQKGIKFYIFDYLGVGYTYQQGQLIETGYKLQSYQ